MAKTPKTADPDPAEDGAPSAVVQAAFNAVVDAAMDRLPDAGTASNSDIKGVYRTVKAAFAAALNPPDPVEPEADEDPAAENEPVA